jgi:hypothetical protein
VLLFLLRYTKQILNAGTYGEEYHNAAAFAAATTAAGSRHASNAHSAHGFHSVHPSPSGGGAGFTSDDGSSLVSWKGEIRLDVFFIRQCWKDETHDDPRTLVVATCVRLNDLLTATNRHPPSTFPHHSPPHHLPPLTPPTVCGLFFPPSPVDPARPFLFRSD